MNTSSSLGFSWCCIGAQKAGTSTLFDLLKRHPDLFIPPDKEVPLFHRSYTEAELAQYLTHHFPAAEVGQRKAGTVTPQYMSSPDTAARLHRSFPYARIIVLLRDPVTRAYSHYRMNIRRGLETRSFSVAVGGQLDQPTTLDPDNEVNTYVQRGLYGSILAPWFDLYGSHDIHVVFTADLEHDQQGVLCSIHQFLGVAPQTGGNEGVRRHADPPRHRFPTLRRQVTGPLRRIGLLERIPANARDYLGYRLESVLAKVAPVVDQEVTPDIVDQLREFYAADGRVLEGLLGRPLPWPK